MNRDNEINQLLTEARFSNASSVLMARYHQFPPEERPIADRNLELIQYWIKKEKAFKQSEEPIQLWDEFINEYLPKLPSSSFPVLQNICSGVMSQIYEKLSLENIGPEDKKPFSHKLSIARSLLWTNRLESAFAYLSQLIKVYPQEPAPWALTGKIYFFHKKYEKSLLFYRESFFINPSILNLWDIKSDLINRLIIYFKENYLEGRKMPDSPQLLQWLAISGVSGGFFPVRRSLSAGEIENLNKRIWVYETKYRSHQKSDDLLNLIRLYAFKIDYFFSLKQEDVVTQTLKKLEMHEPVVYKKIKQMRG